MPKAIPAIPKSWQQFLISVIFIVIFPLAVLAVDLVTKREIPDQDLYLTFSLYIIGAGSSSHEPFTLALSVVLSFFYLLFYGLAAKSGVDCKSGDATVTVFGYIWRYGPAVIFTLIAGSERYNRHVSGSEPFWEFSK